MDGDEYHVLRIMKRAWYVWIFWAAWVLWLIFWVDLALGSLKEREPRAAAIAFVVLGISLAIGVIRWMWKKRRENIL